MTLLKYKLTYILITISSAILCFILANPYIIGLCKSNYNYYKYDMPIVIPSNKLNVGLTRTEVESILGKPYYKSDDDSTYLYYRSLKNYNKDQIVIVKFNNDVVTMLDTNINIKYSSCN